MCKIIGVLFHWLSKCCWYKEDKESVIKFVDKRAHRHTANKWAKHVAQWIGQLEQGKCLASLRFKVFLCRFRYNAPADKCSHRLLYKSSNIDKHLA